MTARKKPTKGAAKKPMPDFVPPPQDIEPPAHPSPMVLPDQPPNPQIIDLAPPASNPIMAAAIAKVTNILKGQGQTSNAAFLLGQANMKVAQLEESLQIAIDALSAMVAEQSKPE